MSMGDWANLCAAAGFNVRNMDPMQVYLTAGKILGYLRNERGDRIAALRAMSPADREALRASVSDNVVQFKKAITDSR